MTSYYCVLDGAPLRIDVQPLDEASIADAIAKVKARPTRYSWLKLMASSPWDYLRAASQEADVDETLSSKLGAGPGRDRETALRFGTAVHQLVLGAPDRVVVYDRAAADAALPATPAKKRRSKEGKHRGVDALLDPAPAGATKGVTRRGAAWEAFSAEHTALAHTILSAAEYAEARAMADMLLRSRRACEWLFDGTIVEQRIDWTLRGRAIRSTPDARRPGAWVADLKSCADSSPDRFRPQIYRLLYHAQLETYLRASEAQDGSRPGSARIVAIDRKRPPRCYEITEEGLELGARCLGAWIETLLTCEASGHFPFDGLHVAPPPEYMTDVELLDVPKEG